MVEFRTFSAQETVDIAYKLGTTLKNGDVICLVGDLGAGKTAFTSGIAKALGISGYITSPTFTIVNEYSALIPLYHFDVYRVADPEEMFEIGFEEYLEGNGVVVIEWADLIKDILPKALIWVDVRKNMTSGPDARIITIDFKGEKYQAYESKLNLDTQL